MKKLSMLLLAFVLVLAVTFVGCKQLENGIAENADKLAANEAAIESLEGQIRDLESRLAQADTDLGTQIAADLADLRAELLLADSIVSQSVQTEKTALTNLIDAINETLGADDNETGEDTVWGKIRNLIDGVGTNEEAIANLQELAAAVEDVIGEDTDEAGTETIWGNINALYAEIGQSTDGSTAGTLYAQINVLKTAVSGLTAAVDTINNETLALYYTKAEIDAYRADVIGTDDAQTGEDTLWGRVRALEGALDGAEAAFTEAINDIWDEIGSSDEEGTIIYRIAALEESTAGIIARLDAFNGADAKSAKERYVEELVRSYANFDTAMNTLKNEVGAEFMIDGYARDTYFENLTTEWKHVMLETLFKGTTAITLADDATSALAAKDEYVERINSFLYVAQFSIAKAVAYNTVSDYTVIAEAITDTKTAILGEIEEVVYDQAVANACETAADVKDYYDGKIAQLTLWTTRAYGLETIYTYLGTQCDAIAALGTTEITAEQQEDLLTMLDAFIDVDDYLDAVATEEQTIGEVVSAIVDADELAMDVVVEGATLYKADYLYARAAGTGTAYIDTLANIAADDLANTTEYASEAKTVITAVVDLDDYVDISVATIADAEAVQTANRAEIDLYRLEATKYNELLAYRNTKNALIEAKENLTSGDVDTDVEAFEAVTNAVPVWANYFGVAAGVDEVTGDPVAPATIVANQLTEDKAAIDLTLAQATAFDTLRGYVTTQTAAIAGMENLTSGEPGCDVETFNAVIVAVPVRADYLALAAGDIAGRLGTDQEAIDLVVAQATAFDTLLGTVTAQTTAVAGMENLTSGEPGCDVETFNAAIEAVPVRADYLALATGDIAGRLGTDQEVIAVLVYKANKLNIARTYAITVVTNYGATYDAYAEKAIVEPMIAGAPALVDYFGAVAVVDETTQEVTTTVRAVVDGIEAADEVEINVLVARLAAFKTVKDYADAKDAYIEGLVVDNDYYDFTEADATAFKARYATLVTTGAGEGTFDTLFAAQGYTTVAAVNDEETGIVAVLEAQIDIVVANADAKSAIVADADAVKVDIADALAGGDITAAQATYLNNVVGSIYATYTVYAETIAEAEANATNAHNELLVSALEADEPYICVNDAIDAFAHANEVSAAHSTRLSNRVTTLYNNFILGNTEPVYHDEENVWAKYLNGEAFPAAIQDAEPDLEITITDKKTLLEFTYELPAAATFAAMSEFVIETIIPVEETTADDYNTFDTWLGKAATGGVFTSMIQTMQQVTAIRVAGDKEDYAGTEAENYEDGRLFNDYNTYLTNYDAVLSDDEKEFMENLYEAKLGAILVATTSQSIEDNYNSAMTQIANICLAYDYAAYVDEIVAENDATLDQQTARRTAIDALYPAVVFTAANGATTEGEVIAYLTASEARAYEAAKIADMAGYEDAYDAAVTDAKSGATATRLTELSALAADLDFEGAETLADAAAVYAEGILNIVKAEQKGDLVENYNAKALAYENLVGTVEGNGLLAAKNTAYGNIATAATETAAIAAKNAGIDAMQAIINAYRAQRQTDYANALAAAKTENSENAFRLTELNNGAYIEGDAAITATSLVYALTDDTYAEVEAAYTAAALTITRAIAAGDLNSAYATRIGNYASQTADLRTVRNTYRGYIAVAAADDVATQLAAGIDAMDGVITIYKNGLKAEVTSDCTSKSGTYGTLAAALATARDNGHTAIGAAGNQTDAIAARDAALAEMQLIVDRYVAQTELNGYAATATTSYGSVSAEIEVARLAGYNAIAEAASADIADELQDAKDAIDAIVIASIADRLTSTFTTYSATYTTIIGDANTGLTGAKNAGLENINGAASVSAAETAYTNADNAMIALIKPVISDRLTATYNGYASEYPTLVGDGSTSGLLYEKNTGATNIGNAATVALAETAYTNADNAMIEIIIDSIETRLTTTFTAYSGTYTTIVGDANTGLTGAKNTGLANIAAATTVADAETAYTNADNAMIALIKPVISTRLTDAFDGYVLAYPSLEGDINTGLTKEKNTGIAGITGAATAAAAETACTDANAAMLAVITTYKTDVLKAAVLSNYTTKVGTYGALADLATERDAGYTAIDGAADETAAVAAKDAALVAMQLVCDKVDAVEAVTSDCATKVSANGTLQGALETARDAGILAINSAANSAAVATEQTAAITAMQLIIDKATAVAYVTSDCATKVSANSAITTTLNTVTLTAALEAARDAGIGVINGAANTAAVTTARDNAVAEMALIVTKYTLNDDYVGELAAAKTAADDPSDTLTALNALAAELNYTGATTELAVNQVYYTGLLAIKYAVYYNNPDYAAIKDGAIADAKTAGDGAIAAAETVGDVAAAYNTATKAFALAGKAIDFEAYYTAKYALADGGQKALLEKLHDSGDVDNYLDPTTFEISALNKVQYSGHGGITGDTSTAVPSTEAEVLANYAIFVGIIDEIMANTYIGA